MPEIIENRDVFSGGSQVVVGSDYRLTTVLSYFKAFETLLEHFLPHRFLQKKIPGAFIFKASGEVSPAGFEPTTF